MEVWIGNDTRRDVTPTRILYSDPRFRRPVPGERLRLTPRAPSAATRCAARGPGVRVSTGGPAG